jgi:hypothetical protein
MAATAKKATARRTTADNLMLTGSVLFCPDCADERIFVVPDCGDGPGAAEDCGDYCCTDCGAAVSVVVESLRPAGSGSSRVA